MAFKRLNRTAKPESAPKKTQQCSMCKGAGKMHIEENILIPLGDALVIAERKSKERVLWADLPERFRREAIECGDCKGKGSV